MATPLLDVRGLRTYHPVTGGVLRRRIGWVKAVDDVSFTIDRGEILGLVGESGCGKTTVGRSIMRLVTPQAGEILLDGEDVLRMPPGRLRKVRSRLQAVFQDPYGALNPRMTVGEAIVEGLQVQGMHSRRERDAAARELLDAVGLPLGAGRRYPHEFSGGQRQRIGIARAVALRPRLIVADEPVSALDVSVQSQILNLLSDLRERFGLAYLFIAHDLGVVEYISDRVAVMYLGRVVELADAGQLYANPRMPYTQALLSAAPAPERPRKDRIVLRGDVPSPLHPPSGCPFRTRCWMAEDRCAEERPALRTVGPGHLAACHFA